MKLYFDDCITVLTGMTPDSVDSTVTDPPYELGFMAKKWDKTGIAYRPETWAAVLRVMKPGAHLLAFGGTRTHHRMVCAIEDAGFEIRDEIDWVYGQGFPKSLNFEDGWGTALKPAKEPICLARKPLIGTVEENRVTHGTGGINIDGCRVEGDVAYANGYHSDETKVQGQVYGWAKSDKFVRCAPDALGRWPANLIHDGSPEVLAAFPDAAGQLADARNDGAPKNNCIFGAMNHRNGRDGEPSADSANEGEVGFKMKPGARRNDSGSAARFFKSCALSEIELFFSRATALLEAWNPDLANTADDHSCLKNEYVDSVLRHAVIVASQGGRRSSSTTPRFTSVTPMQLSRLVTTLITAILFTEKNASLAPSQDEPFHNGSRVRFASSGLGTDTISITISHWRFDGSADGATFNITPSSSDRGEAGCESRIKYCAKATKADREEGCDHLPLQSAADNVDREPDSAGMNSPRAGAGRTAGRRNSHPTVKPTDLMRYLCRLVTPIGGTVLDPFMGSGSTGKAALLEGFDFIGIEKDPAYAAIAKARVRRPALELDW